MAAFPTSSVTSANSVFTLTIPSIFVVPQALVQYSVDDMFGTEAIVPAEILMGVDGTMSSGMNFVPIPMRVTLQANSPSGSVFDEWYLTQIATIDTFAAFGVILLPGLKKKFILHNGILTSYVVLPEAKKVLQPRPFTITWQEIIPAQI